MNSAMKQLSLSQFLIASSILFLSAIYAEAQNTVGIGTDNPNSKAVLELKASGQQGFLMPRLSTADTLTFSVDATDKGLMFYDTTAGVVRHYDGAKWKIFGATSTAVVNPGDFIRKPK